MGWRVAHGCYRFLSLTPEVKTWQVMHTTVSAGVLPHRRTAERQPCAAHALPTHYLQLMGMPLPMSKGQIRSAKLLDTLTPLVFSIRELWQVGRGHSAGGSPEQQATALLVARQECCCYWPLIPKSSRQQKTGLEQAAGPSVGRHTLGRTVGAPGTAQPRPRWRAFPGK